LGKFTAIRETGRGHVQYAHNQRFCVVFEIQ